MSNFEEIELLFSNLLAATSPVLSDSERAEVQKFIDVGEYGLALETAADIYAEEKKIASADAVALVGRLAEAMSIEAAPIAAAAKVPVITERPPSAGVVDSSGADDLQGLGDADETYALVLGHRQQRFVAGDGQIGLGRQRGTDDHIVIRIGRDAWCRRRPHQRGQCRIAIHELIDRQG